jgi:Phage integrase family
MVCFERAVKEAEISDFHFYDLRHTVATRLRAANVHEYYIADLLGHSTTPGERRNSKVTRGYAHSVLKRLRDAVNSLEEGKLAILERANFTPSLREKRERIIVHGHLHISGLSKIG